MSGTEHQTTQEAVTKMYSQLANVLETLHTNAILPSSHAQKPGPVSTACHQFLLPYLPLLLTAQRSQALATLRIAALSITQLSISASQPAQTQLNNFGRALLWALDHAEYLLSLIDQLGDAGELQLVKAIRTIFHLVASFCNQESALEQPLSEQDIDAVREIHATATVPSKHDPVYLPPSRVRSTSAKERPENNLSSEQMVQVDDLFKNHQTKLSSLFSCGSHYIFGNGKLIMPYACMRESAEGCLVPFQVTMKAHKNDNVAFGGLSTRKFEVLYPDQTCFQYIPVQSIRLLHRTFSLYNPLGDISIRGNVTQPMVSMEISSLVYATIIHLCQQPYNQLFPEAHILLPEVSLTVPKSSEIVEIPVVTHCFVRIVDGQQVIEHPLQLALEMFQKDLCGYGLMKVEIMRELDEARIVISLAGIVVGEEELNNNERALHLS